jgi:hypothetical protein
MTPSGLQGCSLSHKSKLKNETFHRHGDIKLLSDLPFSRNLPLKSGGD